MVDGPDPFAVFNQPLPRNGLPLWNGDAVLRGALDGLNADAVSAPKALAAAIGTEEAVASGQRLATGDGPALRTFDNGEGGSIAWNIPRITTR